MPSKSAELRLVNRRKDFIISVFGLGVALLGIMIGMFWEDIFDCVVQKKLILRPDSPVYDNWKSPPLDLNLDIYLFNWTNPEDFYNSSAKPIVEQVGPYRFKEIPDKVDINWQKHNDTVTYKKKSYYFFKQFESNGSLDDVIVTLNAVALSAASKAKYWNSVKRKMVNVGLNLYGQQISITKTVDELLFSGYSDDLLDMARVMPVFGSDIEVPFDKFGWFYTRNGSADLTGVFNVYTGANDISKIGQMHSWNYARHTGFFDSNCGLANGSAGEFQPPNLQKGGSVELFTAEMCRTVPLDYVQTVDVEGLTGYKYAGRERSLDNGTIYPENLCFCGGQCSPSGVMNISSCRFGSPVFMSYPHFLYADEFYVNQVDGIKPHMKDHEFYMILEPKTGVALEVAARFQVNMLVEPIDSISLYEGVPRVFFPLIWFEQKVRITPELAGQLKVLPVLLTSGWITGGLLFSLGIILLCWFPCRQRVKCGKDIENSLERQYPLAKLDKNKKQSNSGALKTPDSSPLLLKHQNPNSTVISSN